MTRATFFALAIVVLVSVWLTAADGRRARHGSAPQNVRPRGPGRGSRGLWVGIKRGHAT